MATFTRRQARGKTVYGVQVRHKGTPLRSATFERLADAKTWAHRMEAQISEGRANPHAQARKHTVTTTIDRYLEHVLPRKGLDTQAMQRYRLRWWQAQLGTYRLVDLHPDLIAQARDVLQQTHAPGTVREYLALLQHVCNVASREWGWLEVNPVPRVQRPQAPQGRVRYLSREELARLLTACQRSTQPLSLIVHIALATGARKREILRLRWSDVELQRGHITFHATKTQEFRGTPLTGTALALFRDHAKVRRLGVDLVFPPRRQARLASIERSWRVALREAEIEDFHFHDLRHTAASYLAMSNASSLDIAAVLGHKSLQMVKRYSHLSEQHTRDVLDRMTSTYLGTSHAG